MSGRMWIKRLGCHADPIQSAGATPGVNLRITLARKRVKMDSLWLWNPWQTSQKSKSGVSLAPWKILMSYKIFKKEPKKQRNFESNLDVKVLIYSWVLDDLFQTIKIKKTELNPIDTRKSATARIFSNHYRNSAGIHDDDTTHPSNQSGSGSVYVAQAYSDYSDPKDTIGREPSSPTAHAYSSGQSSSIFR